MPQSLFNNGHISQKNNDIKIIDRILFDNDTLMYLIKIHQYNKTFSVIFDFAINTNSSILTLKQLLNCIECGL